MHHNLKVAVSNPAPATNVRTCKNGSFSLLSSSEYSLTLWKGGQPGAPEAGAAEGEQLSPEQMLEKIRQQQKENDYLNRQREILKKSYEHTARGTVGCGALNPIDYV
jgi:hypothetical protein